MNINRPMNNGQPIPPPPEVKASQTSYHHERPDRPIIIRPMSTHDIEQFRKTLASSYKCSIEYIVAEIQPFDAVDPKNPDNEKLERIFYYMNLVDKEGKHFKREIFKLVAAKTIRNK